MKSKTPHNSVDYMQEHMFPLYIGITTSEAAYRREMRRLKVESPYPFLCADSVATTHMLSNGEGEVAVIVCLPQPKGFSPQLAGTIAHEATHVWQHIRTYIGEDRPSAELEAYTVEWLVSMFLRKLGFH